jgi:hypothetical protein
MAFIQLAFQFKFVGGILILFGLLLLRPFTVFGTNIWLGGFLVITGAAFLVTGFGIGSYRSWGWFAGAVLVVPLLVVASILALLFAIFYGGVFAIVALVITPLYCYYIGWTLFSRAGRQRYQESVAAMASARDNPDSAAGRLYRRK